MILLFSVLFLVGVHVQVNGFSVEEFKPGNSAVSTSIEVPTAESDMLVRFDAFIMDRHVFTGGDICIAKLGRGKLLEDLRQFQIPNHDNDHMLLNYTFWNTLEHVDYRLLEAEIGAPVDIRKITKNSKHLLSIEIEGDWWPCPVPYEINGAERDTVEAAIEHWEENTPWRFVERRNEPDYLSFITGSGCASWVGRIGGEQVVWLNPMCTVGNAIHEIGHAMGFYHEHGRYDRDEYVRIVDANILPSYAGNFNKNNPDTSNDIGPYDFGSIMHYPADAFANEPGKTTIQNIVPIPPGVTMGQRSDLSNGDIASAENRHDNAEANSGCTASTDDDDSVSPAPPIPSIQTPIPVETQTSSPIPISPITPISEETLSPPSPIVIIQTPSPTERPIDSISPQTETGVTAQEETTNFFSPPGVSPVSEAPPSPSGGGSGRPPPPPRRRRQCTRGVCVIFDG